MKKSIYILLLLLTCSWFSSLAELLPCDSEVGHSAVAEVLALEKSKPVIDKGFGADHEAPHDCHAGACHFGHCAHAYPRIGMQEVKMPKQSILMARTPYALLLATGPKGSLIKPPTWTT